MGGGRYGDGFLEKINTPGLADLDNFRKPAFNLRARNRSEV
jgi:hypothetical protein